MSSDASREILKRLRESHSRRLYEEPEQRRVPRYLYHIATIESRRSILNRGIMPSGNYARKNFGRLMKDFSNTPINKYDNRVYLTTRKDDKSLFTMLNFARQYKGYDKYRVDTSSFDAKYYDDEDSDHGVYTRSVIPANAIELIDTVPPNDKRYWKELGKTNKEYDRLRTAEDYYNYHLEEYRKLKDMGAPVIVIKSSAHQVMKYKQIINSEGKDFLISAV